MATIMRPARVTRNFRAASRSLHDAVAPTQRSCFTSINRTQLPATRAITPTKATTRSILHRCAAFHISIPHGKRAQNGEEIPDQAPPTDFSRMDVLGATPVPSTSVDICMSEGFKLNSGSMIIDGKGLILVGGESFTWQPWGPDKKLVNKKGQWEVPKEAFGIFGLLWPRPDLLILGLGPEIRPLSPETRKHLSSLGLRVEVLDTRNAASQFNMLATERGVDDVAAALIPIGWREGLGAQ